MAINRRSRSGSAPACLGDWWPMHRLAGLIQGMIRAGWMFIIAQQQITYHKSIQPYQRYIVTVSLHAPHLLQFLAIQIQRSPCGRPRLQVEYSSSESKWFQVKHEERAPPATVRSFTTAAGDMHRVSAPHQTPRSVFPKHRCQGQLQHCISCFSLRTCIWLWRMCCIAPCRL